MLELTGLEHDHVANNGHDQNQLQTLRTLITAAMKKHNWSMLRFARECGLPPTTVYSLYRRDRQHQSITPRTLTKLAAGLNVPVQLLIRETYGQADNQWVILLKIWDGLTSESRDELVEMAARLSNSTEEVSS